MKRALIFVCVGAIILVALFLWLRPAGQPAGRDASAVAQNGQARVFSFVWHNGARVSGPAVVRADQGDRIELTIVSDRDDELHVHGYDRHAGVRVGRSTRLTLIADRAGRFPVELHHADRVLTTLEVSPR